MLSPPSTDEVNSAIAVLNSDKTEWHDAEALLVEMVRTGVEAARRSRGMTQTDMGRASGLSQSQVSRIESTPDTASLGVLRRIAEALARGVSKGGESTAGDGSGRGHTLPLARNQHEQE